MIDTAVALVLGAFPGVNVVMAREQRLVPVGGDRSRCAGPVISAAIAMTNRWATTCSRCFATAREAK